MSFCGMRKRERPLRRKEIDKGKGKQRESHPGPDVRDEHFEDFEKFEQTRLLQRKSADFEWARNDQLSVILEILEETSRNTPNWEKEESALGLDRALPAPRPQIPPLKRTRFVDRDSNIRPIPEHQHYEYFGKMSSEQRSSPGTPRPIAPPPRDVSRARNCGHLTKKI